MTDEQVWEDLSRFAQAMKRGATVRLQNIKLGFSYLYDPKNAPDAKELCARHFSEYSVREIIEPPQKKVRPLNAEEWMGVAGCVLLPYRLPEFFQFATVRYDLVEARRLAEQRATCHPPGFPNDVRKLWVEE